jgi:hypothetical protein
MSEQTSTLHVHARPTSRQLVKVIRRQVLRSKLLLAVVIAGFVGPPLLVLSMALVQPGRLEPSSLSPMLLVGPLLSVIVLFVAPRAALRNPALQRLLSEGVHYRFTSQGIHLRTDRAEAQVEWGAVDSVEKLSDVYVLSDANGQLTYLVPRKDFASEESERAFQALVRERVSHSLRF